MKREELQAFFEKAVTELVTTMKNKNADYTAGSDDALANFRACENLDVAGAAQGMLTRMLDKMMRLNSFAKKGAAGLQVKSESVRDTALDLATYSILFAALAHDEAKEST